MNSNKTCKTWYENSFAKDGLGAQRKYPNEELARFIGRKYSSIPFENRRDIRILELGCGSGANMWLLANEGFQTYGIDLAEGSVKIAGEYLRSKNLECELKQADMCEIPYPNSHFDCVVDIFSSNCLTEENYHKCLSEVARVLKTNGSYFCYTPSTESYDHKMATKDDKLDEWTLNGLKRERSPYRKNDYPFRFASPAFVEKICDSLNLRIVYMEKVSRTYHSMKEYFEFLTFEAVKD